MKPSDFKKILNTLNLPKEEITKKVEMFKYLQECAKIPAAEILKRAFRIKPMLRKDSDDRLYWLQEADICFHSFIIFPNFIQSVNEGALKEVHTFQTYHDHGGDRHSLRPSIEEVLRQIPAEYVAQTVAFETYFNPERVKYDADLERHVLFTRLYSGTLPYEIMGQPVICKGKMHRW